MEEIAGFVNGNTTRAKILNLLSTQNGLDCEKIAKKLRVVPAVSNKILAELEQKELVVSESGEYRLTEYGKQVAEYIKRI